MTGTVVILATAAGLLPLGVSGAMPRHRAISRTMSLAQNRARSAQLRHGPFETVGQRIRLTVGRPVHDRYDRAIGQSVVLLPMCAYFEPPLALLASVMLLGRPVIAQRRRDRARDQALLRELPEIVDLYSVALNSGHSIATATREVALRAEGLVATALKELIERVARGQPLDVALDSLSDELGEQVRPISAVLVSGMRYGVAVSESLERVAADLRLARRRHAERSARRLPVVMLFPLVLCVLPAFGLLTVVPVLVQSLQSLSLS